MKQKRLTRLEHELLVALKNCKGSLQSCYDPSEDKRANPIMQAIGRHLESARKIIDKAEDARGRIRVDAPK